MIKENDSSCLVITPDNERYAVASSNVQYVSSADLAVVKFTSDKSYRVAEVGNFDKVAVGSEVYVVGAPAPSDVLPTRGLQITTGSITRIQPPNSEGYILIYTAATAKGMSGSPVFDENARVVAIHGQGDQQGGIKNNFNAGIPIKTFLEANLVGVPLPPISENDNWVYFIVGGVVVIILFFVFAQQIAEGLGYGLGMLVRFIESRSQILLSVLGLGTSIAALAFAFISMFKLPPKPSNPPKPTPASISPNSPRSSVVASPSQATVQATASPLVTPQKLQPTFPNSISPVISDRGQPTYSVRVTSQVVDVKPTDWYFTAFQSLVERYRVIGTYQDQTFRGGEPITRAELIYILAISFNRID